GNVPLVLLPIVCNAELLFLCTLSQTTLPDGTSGTDMLPRPVFLLPGLGTAVQKFLGKWNDLALWANIMVLRPIVCESGRTAFVRAVRGNETLQSLFLQHRIVLPAAVARIRHTVLPDQPFFPKPPFHPGNYVRQLLVVLAIGMVGLDIR